MYTLVKTLAKERGVGKRWETVSIGTDQVKNVFAKFIAFILVLQHTTTGETHAVDSRSLPSSVQFFQGTINEWLVSIGDESLPIMGAIPELSKDKVVVYRDAFAAGYSVEPTPGIASHTANVLPSDKRWLKLEKKGIDPSMFYKNFMISVNGYFHRIDHNGESILVVDGNKSRLISGDANIGIHSYLRVGNIRYRGMYKDSIYRVDTNIPMSSKAIVKFDSPIENGTIGLVIGGILYILDERIFRVINPYCIMINFEMIDLVKWFTEANMNIDLSSLPVTKIEESKHRITRDSLLSDDCIKSILTLSQSFIVVIDAENMYRDKIVPEKVSYSNIFISAKEPIWPLRTNGGRFAEYVYHHEDGLYAVRAHMAKATNWISNTVSDTIKDTIGEFVDPFKPETKTSAYFELIGKDL